MTELDGMMAADDPRHGTQNGYGHLGCRRPRCTSAHSKHQQEPGPRQARARYANARLTAVQWVRTYRPDIWDAIADGADADSLHDRAYSPVRRPSVPSTEEGPK